MTSSYDNVKQNFGVRCELQKHRVTNTLRVMASSYDNVRQKLGVRCEPHIYVV